MRLGIRKSFKVLAPGGSLRKRVALSLAVVRLILVPVIFFAVYYLLVVGRIVERIVSFDAPAATLSQQASIEMLEAQARGTQLFAAVRSLLLCKPTASRFPSWSKSCALYAQLNAADQPLTDRALDALHQYDQQFQNAVANMQKPGDAPTDRIRDVLQAYENDLGGILKGAKNKRAGPIDRRAAHRALDLLIRRSPRRRRRAIPRCNRLLPTCRLPGRMCCG